MKRLSHALKNGGGKTLPIIIDEKGADQSMTVKEELHRMIDAMPDDAVRSLKLFAEFVQSQRRAAENDHDNLTEEDREWLEAGAEDGARALADIEAEIPFEELDEYLRETEKRVKPVRWNPKRQEFEEVPV